MHRTLAIALGTISILLAAQATAAADTFDLIISNGRIVDGTGNPWFRGDLGIRQGVIVRIGDLSADSAGRRIDAADRIVAPGFVDLMGGSTVPLLRDPVSASSKLYQGITTMLVGEGGSVAPQNERTLAGQDEEERRTTTWRTFAEYFGQLEAAGLQLNVVHNVGAAQVRRAIVGDEDRPPSPAELDQMKRLVDDAMRDGAAGLSTALIYPPGTYAKTEEIVELAKVAARHGGVYFSHMRNESGGLIEAIDETIRIGRDAGLPAHIYHLKAAGRENWPLMTQALKVIQQARDGGVDVTADIYPYIRNGIGLGSFIHPRHYAAGADAFLPTLSDPKVRAAIRREIETTSDWENWYRHVGKNWDKVLITSVGPKGDTALVGLSVQGASKKRGGDVWQTFFDLVQAGRIGVAPESMNEDQKRQAMRADFVAFDTDAAPTNPEATPSAHPRAFGTFPRILAKYVRDEKVISLEQAIRKMTSLAATRLLLHDRGRIAPGMAADLVLFDPQRIQDLATFTEPLQYSTGIDVLIVNGVLVIDGGRVTEARPGRVLRHRPPAGPTSEHEER